MSIFDKFLRIRELGIFSIILVFVITASVIDPRFLTKSDNHKITQET